MRSVFRFTPEFLALFAFASTLPRLPLAFGQANGTHPILKVIDERWLTVPKEKNEQHTRVKIFDASCKATVWTDASVEHGKDFVLEYSLSIDVDDLSDTCIQGDIPEIDTRFVLTFEPSADPLKIQFHGEMPPDCSKCKPKRGKAISGSIVVIGRDRFRLSFNGDISGDFELEPLGKK